MTTSGRTGNTRARPKKTLSPSASTTWWAIHAGQSERSFSKTQQAPSVLRKISTRSAQGYWVCTAAKRALVAIAAAARLEVTRMATTKRKPRKIHSS